MSNTLKKVVLIFTLLCIVLLVVFSVELFLLNRGRENTGGLATEPPATVSPPVSIVPPTGPPTEETEPPEGGEQQEETYQESTSTRRELELASDVTLIVHSNDELFEFTDLEPTWIFSQAETGAELEISLIYLPQDEATFASSFLNGYLEGEPSSVRGERQIGRSQLRGVYVTGTTTDSTTIAAWISALSTSEGGNFGMAVVIKYSENAQRDAIFAILDTMEMITDGTETGDQPEVDD